MAPDSLDHRSPHAALERPNALIARWRASPRPRLLFVGHAMGGGVRRHMQDLAALLADTCHILWAQPGPGATLEIRARDQDGEMTAYFALPSEMPGLLGLLRGIGVSRIHVHHLHGLPRATLEVLGALDVPYDVTLHDYYGVHPDGLPAPDEGTAEPARDDPIPAGRVPWDLSLAQWRECFGDLLARAARLIAPSQDVATRYRRMWPGLRIEVKPHPEVPHPPLRSVARVIAPGRLSPEKGLHVIAACALHAREHDLPLFFRILGCTTEPVATSPHVPLDISGEYPDSALFDLLSAEKPDAILLPTQVPETYGYILSAAISSGVPVIASALGAYVERLAQHPRAITLPHDAAPSDWNVALLKATAIHKRDTAGQVALPRTGTLPEHYHRWYTSAFAGTSFALGPEPHLDARHFELPQADIGAESPPLPQLYAAGVECGQLESRNELKRRIDHVSVERAALIEEKEQALSEQQRAQARADQAQHALRMAHARIQEFEHSTSWRLTAPVRIVGRQWKLVLARMRASYATARHVPRQADIARTIWRDHGTAALATRVWTKLSGKRRYRPPLVTRYVQETSIGALSFPRLSATTLPRVSIIIPAYGDPLLTYTCLKSIHANTPGGRFEVIVIDDASPVRLADALSAVDGIRIERNDSNQGFVANCNLGAGLARGEILLFLNNDTIVTPGWLQAIVQTFEQRPQAGLVGAKLVYPDGRLQEAGGIVWRDGSAWNFGRNDDPERPEHNYVREVDYCSGACIAVPAAVFRAVGGFDLRFAPAYYEDTDLAFAVRAAGRRVVYQPRATVIHFEGQTAGTDLDSGMKRHQVINQQRFADKWASVLAGHRANGIEPDLEHDRFARHRVLVIDACMLTPDQDSGSVRMQAILELLIELHCKVTFAADSLEYREPYVSDLQQRGVEVLFHPYVRCLPTVLAERGREFDVIVLSRHYIAAKHLGSVRTFAPHALLVFDTVDLHFLRAERLAELEGGTMAKVGARAKREEEIALIRKSDLTVVVSPVEKALLSRVVPDADVAIVSNVHEILPGGRPYAEREGLVFIGGFQHPPNTDAVLWYAQHVLPHVRRLLPGVTTRIVGADPPATLRDIAADDFVITGHVPDITPFFTGARVSISPLRYGAGVKGKVNLAMSYGLPVVATTPSIEGMHLTPEVDVLVADDALAFAEAIARAYRDEVLWHRLAEGGRANIRAHFSRDVARTALAAVLARTHAGERANSASRSLVSAV